MRRVLILLATIIVVLVATVAAAWLLRFHLADRLIERHLAAAGVPASYRISRIDPFHQRIENMRIGDPTAPDLRAGRMDLFLGYNLRGPYVRGIRAEHVRLRGRVDHNGLSLGALDRLLPRSGGGGVSLPDLDLALIDNRLMLATPNGMVAATLDGSGNPRRSFRGTASLVAPEVRIASCRLDRLRSDLIVTVRSGVPAADGDAVVGRLACPNVALGRGRLRLAAQSDAAFRRLSFQAAPTGFGGSAGPIRFARIAGNVQGRGGSGAFDMTARLSFAALSIPSAVQAVRGVAVPGGTPIAPTFARARRAVASLLSGTDARIAADLHVRDRTLSADVRQLVLTGGDGGRLAAVPAGGLTWNEQGLRLDADLSGGGGALPAFAIRLRQDRPGAPLTGTARLATYRAGAASLAIPTMRFTWAERRLVVDGRVRMDGPLSEGTVRGLDVPVRGWADAGGAFTAGQGCETAVAAAVKLASVTFSNVRLPFCGRPLIARRPGGAVQVNASIGPLRLRGRTDAGAAVTVIAGATDLSAHGFTVHDLATHLGDAATPTRLAVARLDGSFAAGAVGGTFAGASARIGAVPLALGDGAGQWRLAGGALRVNGDLRISDTDPAQRFHPLLANDAALVLADGGITASAVLREPATRTEVARVTLHHDLARGDGHALLAVDGLRFTPKGLQPDALTPLTLGVIANVSGLVDGRGRVDWNARGVTSSGSFGSDALNFAAAFGPVTGLRGRIVFTDLLGLVSAPDQAMTIAEINPGIAIANGAVRFHLPGQNRIAIDDARWPFAGGTLRLDPASIDMAADRDRRLTFRLDALDAAAFVQQLDLPNISTTGTFDGVLPMTFGQAGGRIDAGSIRARQPGGTIAYVGDLTNANLGTMGSLAFDALKAIRYSTLTIALDGQLDGEMVSRVSFTGVREATPEQSLVTRLIRNLPFRFNISLRAPFRGLLGTARTYIDPQLLLRQPVLNPPPVIQPPASGGVR